MPRYPSPEDEWRAYIDGTHYQIVWGRRLFRYIPYAPRCFVCLAPFGGPGGIAFRIAGITRWDKNPNVCNHCIRGLVRHEVMGAEAEISFLFADVRHSSDLARSMGNLDFARLMQRFYRVANDVLLEHRAILDKFVGDEAVGFFMPFMTGPDHAGAALRAARSLLLATGHGDAGGPWIPLGIGVNAGTTFVGMVSSGSGSEFTAFGDPINVAAHLATVAGVGEILAGTAAIDATRLAATKPATAQPATAQPDAAQPDAAQPAADVFGTAGFDPDGLERRRLDLKGRQVDAVVLSPAGLPSP